MSLININQLGQINYGDIVLVNTYYRNVLFIKDQFGKKKYIRMRAGPRVDFQPSPQLIAQLIAYSAWYSGSWV